jgi:hypothetical protein
MLLIADLNQPRIGNFRSDATPLVWTPSKGWPKVAKQIVRVPGSRLAQAKFRRIVMSPLKPALHPHYQASTPRSY